MRVGQAARLLVGWELNSGWYTEFAQKMKLPLSTGKEGLSVFPFACHHQAI